MPGAGAGDSGGSEEPKHEPGEEPDGQDEDQGKRPHVVVDNDVIPYGWELAQSLRYAALLAPELFAGMHPDTPRKWKLRVARGRGVPSWLTWHTSKAVCRLSSHLSPRRLRWTTSTRRTMRARQTTKDC